MHRLPKEIKVGPYVWKVVRVTKAVQPDEWGKCDYQTLQIRIRIGLPRGRVREVILHEIQHAITYNSGVKEDAVMCEEEWIERITHVLLEVLRENPELVSYLLDEQ